MCKIYTGYHGTSEIEHGLCAYAVDNPLAKARGLSLPTGTQTMLFLSHIYLFMTEVFSNRGQVRGRGFESCYDDSACT